VIEASLARFIQYGGATILFGAALFFLTSLPRSGETAASNLRWAHPFLAAGAALVFLGAALSLAFQSAMMNGVSLAKLDWPAIELVLTATSWGLAITARIVIGLIALSLVLILRPARALWLSSAGLGALILASFAWTGHGAATTGAWGWVHLVSDIIHAIAAGAWIGALVCFLALLMKGRPSDVELEVLYKALHHFSGTGSLLVATLIATGLINIIFIVGLSGVTTLLSSTYSALLVAKLFLFLVMLGFASWNRFRLTPRLQQSIQSGDRKTAIASLRTSLWLEAGLGMLVILLVGFLGMTDPFA
jgi:copper resistance protein D